jgi:hypothetical protein
MSDKPRGRAGHLFTFPAARIAEACEAEAKYHLVRLAYWQGEQDAATEIVTETCSAKVAKREHTGGYTVDVVVNYGDPAAYQRMQESARKVQTHRDLAERFETERDVYATQDGTYELTQEDVHYFRLGGGGREE